MSWHDLTRFSFAQPWWLLLLLLPALLAWRRGRAGGAPAVMYSSTAILQTLGRPRAARPGALAETLLIATLALAVVAFARPQLSNSFTQIEASGIDIMIALDVSGSMLTEDFSISGQRASRVEAIKEITQRFIEQRPNDRIGMLAFAGRPYLVSPPTLDHAWLIDNLDRIKIGLVEDGTAIGSALISAANRLKNREAKSRIIVLLSDGDNNAGRVNPDTAAEAVRVLNSEGVHRRRRHQRHRALPGAQRPFHGRDDLRKRAGRVRRKNAASEVARIANGHFFRADSSAKLEEIYSQIDKLEKTTDIKVSKYREYRDLFGWLVATAVGCLGCHTLLSQTLWRRLP